MTATPKPRDPLAGNAADRMMGTAGRIGVVVGGVVLLLIAVASVVLAARNDENRAAFARSQQTQAVLFRLMWRVQDAETSQRGFLLTAKESYLQPYYRAITLLPSDLDVLEEQLPNRQAIVSRLSANVQAKIEELRQTVYLGRLQDMDAAMTVVDTDKGKLLMDAIRADLTQLLSHEASALRRLDRSGARDSVLLLVTDTVGALLVISLATVVILGIRRNIRALNAVRAALRSANAQLAATNAVLAGTNEMLEQRVAERTQDLQAANDEIQRFAYIVSHDLRAPLVNIMGFTSELEAAAGQLQRWIKQQPSLPEDVTLAANDDLPEAIRFIKTSTAKMDRLIGAILKLSREGRRNLAPEQLDMSALLTTLLDTVRFQAGESGTEVEVGAVPDLVGDKVAVEQVFGNVLENALKYRQPGRPGRVKVRGSVQGPNVAYEIEDNGRGIAARDHERVFELFRRAGDQTVPGEGIGLAHVRALVRRMGGTIDFTSELGRGTTFRIVLPATPDRAVASKMDEAA